MSFGPESALTAPVTSTTSTLALLRRQMDLPGVALLIVVSAAFCSRFSLEVAGASVRPEHVATLLLVTTLLIRSDSRDALLAHARSGPAVLLALYVIWAAVTSLLLSPDLSGSVRIAGWLMLDWLLFVCISSLAAKAAMTVTAGVGLSVLSGAVAVVVWVVATAGGPLWGVSYDPDYDILTSFVAGYEPNILAGTMVLWLLVLVVTKDGGGLMRLAAVTAVITAGVVATDTRAAFIVILAGPAMVAVLSRRHVRRRALLSLGVATLTLVVALSARAGFMDLSSASSPQSSARFSQTDVTGGTTNYRIIISRMALKDLRDGSFVLGRGLGSFSTYHAEPGAPQRRAYLSNLPLQVLYDSGIPGVLFLGWAFGLILWRLPDRLRFPALGIAGAYVLLAVFTSPLWFATTWIIAGLASGYSRARGTTEPRTPRTREAEASGH